MASSSPIGVPVRKASGAATPQRSVSSSPSGGKSSRSSSPAPIRPSTSSGSSGVRARPQSPSSRRAAAGSEGYDGSTSVLITGCSRGSLGGALAASFARRKLTVFATARDVSKIDGALRSLPNVHALELDVTRAESIAGAVQAVRVKTDGKLHFLINNAGAGYTTPLADVDIELGKKIFDVNYWGVLAVTKALVPCLVAASGTVMNVSSVGGLVNTPWIGIYSSSKAALTCASETLRLELSPLNVTVLTAMLGAVETKFHTNTTPTRLPRTSLYACIAHIIADCGSGKLNPPGTDADTVADRLVEDMLQGARGRVYRANMSSTTKWLSALLPASTLDGMMAKDRGLDELRKKFNSGQAGGDGGGRAGQ